MVLAAEVGGRWSTEARDFLVALATAKAREAPFLLESSVKAAWLFRWSCMLACTAARSFALSLVDGFGRGVVGAVLTLCDVRSEARYLRGAACGISSRGLTDPSHSLSRKKNTQKNLNNKFQTTQTKNSKKKITYN